MGSTAFPVDLPALWLEPGVGIDGDRVRFDNQAPLADVRNAMIGLPRK